MQRSIDRAVEQPFSASISVKHSRLYDPDPIFTVRRVGRRLGDGA